MSVLLITYNHEQYIGRCLDSILKQRGVSFELIVSEDYSTDNTLNVVKAKLADFGEGQLIASERNLAANQTVLRAIRAARGRYVSLIDGDDYWLVDDKLERQVELLDANPNLAACFHNAEIVHGGAEKPSRERWTPATQPERAGLAELWEGNPFATCAGLMRRKALSSIGDWYGALGQPTATPMVTDWPLYLACAEHGDIGFINEVVGAYRLHDGGCYSSLPPHEKLNATANVYRAMRAGFGARHERLAAPGSAHYFTDWMDEYGRQNETSLARAAAWHAVKTGGVGAALGWRSWLGKAVRAVR